MKDEEYEKLVKAQIEANEKIKEKENYENFKNRFNSISNCNYINTNILG